MEILWSADKVEDLCSIVEYFKRNNGRQLEILAQYFISKNSSHLNIEKYTMEFEGDVDVYKIEDGEYKLAYICELVNSQTKKNKTYSSIINSNNAKKYKDVADFQNVYSCLAFMIRYCLSKKIKDISGKLDYKILFLKSLLSEKIKLTDEQFILSYFLTLDIISANEENNIFENSSLISRTEILDLSLFSFPNIRDICHILKTKRSIYARIFLVLTYEISKTKNILDPLWLTGINFKNRKEFIYQMTSPLTESLIYLTSQKI